MFLMTTRSSRFFVVLLHLVGVSTHLPSYLTETGIVGVNPFSIVLERLDPNSLSNDEEQSAHIPHWLQDSVDGTCLGPMGGFSECGDATLWFILPRQRRDARRRQLFRWATEQDEDNDSSGYALQVVEDDTYLRSSSSSSNTPTNVTENDKDRSNNKRSSYFSSYMNTYSKTNNNNNNDEQKECLTRRKRDKRLVLTSCSKEQAWSWQVNGQGILYFDHSSSARGGRKYNHHKDRPRLKKPKLNCIWRNASEAVLTECDGDAPTQHPPHEDDAYGSDKRLVQFALVRQATTLAASASSSTSGGSSSDRIQRTVTATTEKNIPTAEEVHVPHKVDIAHSHASGPAKHSELKPQVSRLMNMAPASKHYTESSANKQQPQQHHQEPTTKQQQQQRKQQPPLEFFKNTNPILLASGRVLESRNEQDQGGTSSSLSSKLPSSSTRSSPSSSSSSSSSSKSGVTGGGGQDVSSSSSSLHNMKPGIRKIQVHPYIATAKDEIWTDPQTGLEYRTDICRYLGHDRKESGRHTLAGVGQYMRTVFNIKVYGVAFYVSKRDVLADPAMEPYASLSSTELRQRPDFFATLRHMVSSHPDTHAGNFDRTLLLKTNMQLSTETMRSSLEADWKLLSPEATELLVGTSLEPRAASESMLQVISSKDNPSRCSCAQVAPEEYQADMSCCARGTELVFTWRKNGDFEIRVNGEMMETFNRPDIAAGIFYEYLRTDDPMSVDFLDHVVDGFPFLLAPLSQVKGVSTPVRSKPGEVTPKATFTEKYPVFKAVTGIGEVVTSHAAGFAGIVQNGAAEMSNNAMNTVRSVGDAARNLGEEMDRKRDAVKEHVTTIAHKALSSLSGKDQKALAVVLPTWIGEMSNLNLGDGLGHGESGMNSPPRGKIFRIPFARLFGEEELPPAPDEIVPMIHQSTNSTHRIFLGLVHMYLLLLLIVSFPAHRTTVTKLVIRKSAFSESDHSDSSESSSYYDMTPVKDRELDRLGGYPKKLPSQSSPRRFRALRTALHPRHKNRADTANTENSTTASDEASKSSQDGKIQKSLSYVL